MNEDEIIWIASFDIGKCNFAFCVEEINLSLLKSINNIKKEDRYNIDGTCQLKFESLLKNIYLSGKCILLRNYDLTEGTDKDKYFDTDICYKPHFPNQEMICF